MAPSPLLDLGIDHIIHSNLSIESGQPDQRILIGKQHGMTIIGPSEKSIYGYSVRNEWINTRYHVQDQIPVIGLGLLVKIETQEGIRLTMMHNRYETLPNIQYTSVPIRDIEREQWRQFED